jgi:epoxide hydrolase-like predicted phosphatase
VINTIIFDLSEVYLHGMRGIEERIAKTLGMDIVQELWREKESEQLFHGKLSEEEYWQTFIDRYKWKIDQENLKRLIRENMTEIKGTREIIETLKEERYTLGLLSVHAKEWILHCEKQFDYHKLFKSVMYSFETGVSKPDKKAFELILKKLKVNPKECLFVDDYVKNIDAAKKLGMKGIQFINANQLKKDLRQYNINI